MMTVMDLLTRTTVFTLDGKMNEVIKQLADKSCMTAVKANISDVVEGCYIVSDDLLEKFAQAVVLECERVAKDPNWYSERPSDGWRNPIRHVCGVMKQHFGVG